jgi:peptide-methionine (S)-S-oxide reductase
MLKLKQSGVPGLVIVATVMVGIAGCSQGVTADAQTEDAPAEGTAGASPAGGSSAGGIAEDSPAARSATPATALRELVLAGGCFWCMEAGFEQLRGVTDVVSGYAGGSRENASYRIVAAGLTSHAEAIRITYDPQIISEETLLKVFFLAAHDPTQLNRQGPDVGRQYRSAVFYDSDEQKQRAEKLIAELDASGRFDKKIATTLEPLEGFFVAEDYHQDYAKLNPDQPYVVVHSQPKAAKVCRDFPELVRQIEGLENATGDKVDQADRNRQRGGEGRSESAAP